MRFFQYWPRLVNYLQIIKEHIEVRFIAHIYKQISVFRHINVLQLGVRLPMTFYCAASANPAKVTTRIFKLLIEEYVVDIGFGNSCSAFVVDTPEESRWNKAAIRVIEC